MTPELKPDSSEYSHFVEVLRQSPSFARLSVAKVSGMTHSPPPCV